MAENLNTTPKAKKPLLARNLISLCGSILAISSFFALVCLIAIDLFRGFDNPYMGVLTYLMAPVFLIIGLFLIFIGTLWERRRRRKLAAGEVLAYPRLDLNIPRQRRGFIVFVVVTFVFMLLAALGSYRMYLFTESVTFCGQVCHKMMQPEFIAYQGSPHARVACVQCHIGAGATWYVKAKLTGVYQVYATLAEKYSRPIPVPVKNLRPAQETCEQCHWPQKFYGSAQREIHHYLGDENNTHWMIQMLIKTGGGDPSFGPVGGIHWHMNIANKVEYIHTDEGRQVIPWVRMTDKDGKTTVYQSTETPLTPQQLAAAQPRTMDCIDCHNRPSHIYNSPIHSVNLAIRTGRIDTSIPFIKQQAVLALAQKYDTTDEAVRNISTTLTTYYQNTYPDFAKANTQLLAKAIGEVKEIYTHNFFPHMKVDWRAYPNNIGHMNFVGCDRCHDGKHTSDQGKTITRDCNACHTIVAQGRDKNVKTSLEGLQFQHPINIGNAWQETKCSECHKGTLVE